MAIDVIRKVFIENKSTCRSIMTPNNCDKVKTFCMDTSKFFWCPYGKYLDVNNLSCDTSCPEGFTRPPDVRDGYGRNIGKVCDDGDVRDEYGRKIGEIRDDGEIRDADGRVVGRADGKDRNVAAHHFFFNK